MRVPISDLVPRAPEQGRIRFGKKTPTKNGGSRPTALGTFRFTSPDRVAIEKLAAEYGGEAKPWEEPTAAVRGQWEVVTDAQSIAVWLPEDAYSVAYEMWSGGGCQRRCDGNEVRVPDEREPIPCICNSTGRDVCKPKSRVQLILPIVGFGGTWRLETSSEYFMYEAPGMIQMLRMIYPEPGMSRMRLSLSQRTSRASGETKHFVVPQFSSDDTPDQMLQGLSQVRSISSPTHGMLELDAGEALDPVWHQSIKDDEVIDAEVIEEPAAEEPDGWDDLNAARKAGVRVKRNPEPGPKWVRA